MRLAKAGRRQTKYFPFLSGLSRGQRQGQSEARALFEENGRVVRIGKSQVAGYGHLVRQERQTASGTDNTPQDGLATKTDDLKGARFGQS